MNISGIRTYAGFYDYNTIKDSEIRSQQIQESKSTPDDQAGAQDTDIQMLSAESREEQKPDTGAMDYAKLYQPDVAYDLKGTDSDIVSLDVEKAISDMQKDQVIQQYQFFVGESEAGAGLMQMRENENFFL